MGAKNTFLRQADAGSVCAADGGCLWQTYLIFSLMYQKQAKSEVETSVSLVSSRGEGAMDFFFFASQTKNKLPISLAQH